MAVASKLTRYREISTLGSGGMATVVLAEDTLLGRRVALKRVSGAADLRALSRLRREAQLGASISHPNLVSIYDVLDAEDGDVVIVMEYVPGENLRDRLRREHALDPHEAVRILAGVAAGLDAIHARGIVHRDVKPPNVLLGSDGTVKLADLGIASVPESTRITTAGTLLGSFSYMAPEQLRDAPATPAIDIYALAAMAFEMLSGAKARPEPTALAVAHALATQPPPDLRAAWPKAPAAAARALRRGMARDPGRRPRSAGELVGELREAFEPRPGGTQITRAAVVAAPVDEGKPGTARRGAPLFAALAVGLVALAVALVVATNGPGTRHHTTSAGVSRPRAPTGHAGRPTATKKAAAPAPSRHVASATTSTHSATVGVPPANSGPGATGHSGAKAAGPGGGARTNPGSTASTATPSGGPVSSVKSFYELAAAHRYAQAWALADPTFRRQLGGYQSFESGQQGDRSITFDLAQVTSTSPGAAVVAVRTTSVRVTGTQHCGGTVDVVRSGSSWLLHLIDINCS